MTIIVTWPQAGTTWGLSLQANFLKILSSKCVNAVNQVFWSKTTVFSLPATEIQFMLMLVSTLVQNLLQPGSRKQHIYTWNEDRRLRTPHWGVRTMDWGLRTVEWGLRIVDRGLSIEDWWVRTIDWGLRTVEWGSRIEDRRLRTEDSFAPSGSSFLIPHSSVFIAFEPKKSYKLEEKFEKILASRLLACNNLCQPA